jgi:hypothetical protein
MKRGVLYAVSCCIACAGFVGWRIRVLANHSAPQFEIVADPSLSHPEGCESLLGLADQALHGEGVSPDSTLTILVLGDATTANEPWELGRYSIPVTRKVLEGKIANLRRQEDLLSDIRHKCEGIRRTSISPIFLGVEQGIADLRAHGCKENSHCRVFVDSDLEENAETSIKEALNRTRNTKLQRLSPLDNQGIEVSFCGLAVTAGRIVNASGRMESLGTSLRGPGREDRLRQVWRTLFISPETVTFEPYCPSPRDLGSYPTGVVSTKRKLKP